MQEKNDKFKYLSFCLLFCVLECMYEISIFGRDRALCFALAPFGCFTYIPIAEETL